MAIHSIQQITINGSPRFFNSYVYAARLSINYESPSILKLNLISEDGKYPISSANLNQTYCNPFQINLGSQISFAGFLEDIVHSVSPGGNTLEVTFTDTSRSLDIVNIGLFKRHGLKSSSNLIIVGKELNPCEADPYGNPPPTFSDPCSPCVNKQQVEASKVDCEAKNKYSILDVVYNFSELLRALRVRGFRISGGVDPNPNYTAQHTGSLREVLQAWCADFGFFFYWDNGVLVFQDLRNTIQVAANIESFCPNVLEFTTSYSMKDTFKTATVTNFSRPGDPASFHECQIAKYIEAESLMQNTSYSMPLTITPEIDRVAAGLAYYSEELRNLYYFFVKYQMNGDSKFKSGTKLEKLGMTILSSAIKLDSVSSSSTPIEEATPPKEIEDIPATAKSIDPFLSTNESALSKTQKENSESIKKNIDFYNCVQLLDFETQWIIVNKPKDYFFFLASRNEALNNKYLEEEKAFAGFLNKYAVYVPASDDPFFEDYDFELDNLCGRSFFTNTQTVEYNFTPSNVTFYNSSAKGNAAGEGAPINDLPFSRFLSVVRDSMSRTGGSSSFNIPFKLIIAERGQNPFEPDGATQGEGKNFPAIRNYGMLDQVGKYFPIAAGNKNNLKGEFIGRLLGSAGSAKVGDVHLFVCGGISQDSFRLTEIQGFNNSAVKGSIFDGKPINKENTPSLQNQKIVFQYPDLKCKILGNHSYGSADALHARKVVLKTPVGTFSYTEPTDSLFGIVIEKTTRKKRKVEKIESFLSSNLDGNSCGFSRLLVNAKNISDDRLKVLTKKNDICQFDKKQIEEIHQKFSRNLSINHTQPTVSKTFKIAGLVLSGLAPSIGNGLISLEVGLDSNNGVYSVYEFGTRLMKLPNEEALKFNSILNTRMPRGSYSSSSNYFPLVNNSNV